MGAKILLPVKAHVKKYLLYTHGPQLDVSARGYLPFLILKMLEKHKKQDPSKVRPSQRLIDGKIFISYNVYVGDKYEKTLYISNANILHFNDCIDDLLREEMYRYIHHPNATDECVDYNIKRFREMYTISEDELPFDNLKRWYYRERERINTRLKAPEPFKPQMTLSFSKEEPETKIIPLVEPTPHLQLQLI